jgi:type IV pilus assembly protein PilF
MELKDDAAADASFQRGLKLAPQDPDLNHNYGWFLCQTGREQQSVQWFMNAIKNPLYPTPSKSYAAAGRCLQKQNPAESVSLNALKLDPNTVRR